MIKKAGSYLAFIPILLLIAFLSGFYVGRGAAPHSATIMVLSAPTSDNTLPITAFAPAESAAPTTYQTEQTTMQAEAPSAFPLNINTATVSQLTELPGIGEVLAGRIVAYREQNGAFTEKSQLMQVSGIGEKRLEAIWDLIYIGG